MFVTPVAWTVFDDRKAANAGWIEHGRDTGAGSTSADDLAEFAGRNCYQSWQRPRPQTATNEGYLANILDMGHESVLEHSSVTFYVEGVSRALLTELTRHRHLSFSVVSQRYVDVGRFDPVMPPILNELTETQAEIAWDIIRSGNKYAERRYYKLVEIFENQGRSRKRAREAARAVVPNNTDSPMVVTGNIRAWRDVLGKRHHVAADAELQLFAAEVLRHLRNTAPNSVQDIPDAAGGAQS